MDLSSVHVDLEQVVVKHMAQLEACTGVVAVVSAMMSCYT